MAYIDSKQTLIDCRRKIVKHYLTTWLFFDIIVTFPYSSLANNQEHEIGSSKARIVSFLELLKMLKLIKLRHIFYGQNKLHVLIKSAFQHIERLQRLF